mgnify:CR=1 FL=1
MPHPHPVKIGRKTRMSFSQIDEVAELPNLIELQLDSYNWFVNEGLREVFEEVFPIEDYTGNIKLEFVDYKLENDSKYDVEESKERDVNYAAPLKVQVRLTVPDEDGSRIVKNETGDPVFLGDFPLMTEKGTFIINGAERVIVSQLVRSPGVYYAQEIDKSGKQLISSTVIPNRGAWLEYETDSNDVVSVRIDRDRKQPITMLLRAFGYGTDEQIIQLLGDDERIQATLAKDNTNSREEGIIEIYKKMRPGEPPTLESAESLLHMMFFDSKRYDLAKVGRYKFNKKLAISARAIGRVLAEDVVNPYTGELVMETGTKVTYQNAHLIDDCGCEYVYVQIDDTKSVKVIGNRFVDIHNFIDIDISDLKIKQKVRYNILKEILDEATNDEELKDLIKRRKRELVPKHIVIEDIVASISYQFNLFYGLGNVDDIDHLGNRRVRSVGELLQNQFRIGLSRMERVIRERMTVQDTMELTPNSLINIRPVTAAIKEFFGSSQLSQFMDQNNPLAELTHKRRLSALGPGGLSRERAGFEVRDVHNSHYGRICPIETPEGPNIGLIASLSTYGKVNKYGFIETPFVKINDGKADFNDIRYLAADEEEGLFIAQADTPIDKDGNFLTDEVVCRYGDEIVHIDKSKVDILDVSPKQLVSVSAGLIPFLEHDDANRALMGSNMQRQAVPLLKTEAPYVGTGLERKVAVDSGAVITSKAAGTVTFVDARKIVVTDEDGKEYSHRLLNFEKSNQSMCLHQKPIIDLGDKVQKGDIIADGPSTAGGDLALGKNILLAFMPWEGYNFEDGILISERLRKDDVFTSIHIEEFDIEARTTKLGDEEITREIPNVSEEALRNLDENGIIRIGAHVTPDDILVGKVTPKGETEPPAEEKLLRAIFGEKAKDVRDTSLRLPHGVKGTVVDVLELSKENGDDLKAGVNKLIRIYIAEKRKIMVGDKMSGRHGNKGVISRVLPIEDMPHLEDGTPIDVCLNPLGVPSRMNIGQVLEVHLGLAIGDIDKYIATPVFDGASEDDVKNYLEEAGYSRTGKVKLIDGRTGQPFDNPVTVGRMYMLKLHHLVEDKMHARAIGPYSLVTQQPLGGKAQFGGQRLGEMEVWALEAYGASNILQEMLTVKSDDISGRTKTYEAIVKGQAMPEADAPESFRVLIKEFQSLGLDVALYDKDGEQIELDKNVDA